MDCGSGKKLAQDLQFKLTVDKRSGDITFADHGKIGKQNFGEAYERFIARMRVNGNTRLLYERTYRTYVQPVFARKSTSSLQATKGRALDRRRRRPSWSPRPPQEGISKGTAPPACESVSLGLAGSTGTIDYNLSMWDHQ